jgi:hypothetical protein
MKGMTVHPAATAPRTEELLTHEAVRLRNRDRSGRSQVGLVALAIFFGAVGYLMAFHPGIITYGTPDSSSFPLGAVLSAFGVLELLAAVLLAAAAVRMARPGDPWGDPAPGDCPACGQAALRRDEIVLREGNTLNTRASGTVTLCGTEDCHYASAEVAGPGAQG